MIYPQTIHFILNELEANGHKGWIVGGAVRDTLRGAVPNDYDVATTALPTEICAVFEHTIPIGIAHGTVAVVVDDAVVEVTTLRFDGTYEDGRRPTEVFFTADVKEDLSRRDFTINAMAYHPQEGLIDPYGGQEDLRDRLIRCVGDPDLRFGEDALRLLRAVRFASRFGAVIEEDTWQALKRHAPDLVKVSRERITNEVIRILQAERPSYGLRLLAESRLLDVISPELAAMVGFEQHSPYHHLTVWEHTLAVVDNVRNDLDLRLAALLHDVGKPETFTRDEKGKGHFYGHETVSEKMAAGIMEKWRLSRQQIRRVSLLVGRHMIKYTKFRRHKIKKWIQQAGAENIADLCCLMVADEMGKRPPYRFGRIYRFEQLCDEIVRSGEPLSVADLALSGRDLQQMGLEGPEIGRGLAKLLEVVLVEPRFNKPDYLKSRICHWTSDGTLQTSRKKV